MTTVTLRYFAWVRERTGLPEEQIALPDDVATVGELLAWLKTRGPEFEHAFEQEAVIRTAVDHVHAGPEVSIREAREIAFFPPMTGG